MDHGQQHHSQQQQQQQQHQQLPAGQQMLPQQIAFAMQHQMLPPQQQHSNAAPQDVLAEARKNLQVLIDSGLSKDLLHQWVDENSGSLLGGLSLPVASQQPQQQQQQQSQQQQLPPSHPPPPPPTHQHSPTAHTPPQLPHSTPPQQHSPQEPSHPPPPPPQCPPPPIPTMASNHASSSPTPIVEVTQHHNTIPEHSATPWSPTHHPVMGANMNGGPAELDASIFVPPSAPFAHRPRISVSSTSSGSSGHASIWSNSSSHTAMSWQSGGTGFKSLTSPTQSPTGVMGGSSSSGGKTNVYWCTSCETSFKRKYDWKRHEDEFHERWRKYPCPEPGCNRSFWGSNSFNQHHKTCHGCTTCPHAEKVVRFLRKRKYWACGFCSALHPARERHVEHVARHFESGCSKADWMHSRVVYGLLHQPLIHEAWEALVTSKQAEHGGRRPQFSWHPSKTGRAQGFLEKETPGQLQDLLEFFNGDEGQAQFIVCHAYELADIVMNTGPSPSPSFAEGGMAAASLFSQDPRMSYASLSSQGSTPTATPQPQQHHPMMQQHPHDGHPNNPYTSFNQPMFVQTQPFAPPPPHRAGSDVSSHSPLTATHSPLTVSPSPGIKRELPPVPTQAASRENLMDFDFSPSQVTFEDWESFSGTFTDENSQNLQQTQGQGQQPSWMLPMFTSS